MKTRKFFLVFIGILSISALCLPVQARSMIYDILAKGSEWTLNVDGEEGTLELLGGSGSSTGGSGWKMAMEIRWQGNAGILRAEANDDNTQQQVVLIVTHKDGRQVTCEGYISQENEESMAGTTRQAAATEEINGAWYAVKKTSTPGVMLKRPIRRADIRPNTRREIRLLDTEPPKAAIKVEGILVFTLNDTIKLRASAEDNVKVAQVAVYIDGQEKKTCQAWECRYSEILTQPGPHKCWTVALDAAGNKGQSDTVEFMVHPSSKPGPSLTTKAQPYKPTSQDKVTFLADASHPSGVQSVTIFVNGQAVKTCNQSHCEYVGGPYAGPEVVWRVSAQSGDGGITYGYDSTLPVTQKQGGSASISGKAFGSGASLAGVFMINLYGPDNLSLFRETGHFGQDGTYTFTGLPAGQYKLVVDTKADTFVGPHPAYQIVNCGTGPVANIDFELK